MGILKNIMALLFVLLLFAGMLLTSSCRTRNKCNDCPRWSRQIDKNHSPSSHI